MLVCTESRPSWPVTVQVAMRASQALAGRRSSRSPARWAGLLAHEAWHVAALQAPPGTAAVACCPNMSVVAALARRRSWGRPCAPPFTGRCRVQSSASHVHRPLQGLMGASQPQSTPASWAWRVGRPAQKRTPSLPRPPPCLHPCTWCAAPLQTGCSGAGLGQQALPAGDRHIPAQPCPDGCACDSQKCFLQDFAEDPSVSISTPATPAADCPQQVTPATAVHACPAAGAWVLHV